MRSCINVRTVMAFQVPPKTFRLDDRITQRVISKLSGRRLRKARVP